MAVEGGEAAGRAVLKALSSAPLEGECTIPPRGAIIGRDAAAAEVVVTGATVSRRHCRVGRDTADGWWIEDLNSTNGLFVDGARVTGRSSLSAGQVIGLGSRDHPDFAFYPAEDIDKARDFVVAAADRWTVGRAIDAEISFPADSGVSLRHAELVSTRAGLELRDCRSLNGSFVDGGRVNRARVRPDSVIAVGSTRFRVELEQDGRLRIHVLGAAGRINLQGLDIGRRIRLWPSRRNIELLRDVSLVVEPGEFAGILGPSGAGKTTLLKTVNGYGPPTAGQVLFNDVPLYSQFDLFRASIGYVPQDDIIHRDLSVRQCLNYIARLRLPADFGPDERLKLLDTTLETLGLAHVADTPVERLSGGQRKRVSIAAELITRPGILFLDEPTSGLDPSTEELLMRHFRDLAHAGRTVIITTHILYNLALLDRVVIVARGRLCFFGTPDQALEFFAELDPESDGRAVRPTRIFELLEGAADADKATAGNTSAVLGEIADRVAARYRQSDYHREHIESRISGLGRKLLAGDDSRATEPSRRLRIPRLSARGIRRALPVLAERHARIRLAGWRAWLVYLGLPLALALVTLSMSMPEVIDGAESASARQDIASVFDRAPFPAGNLIRTLFSEQGTDDPRSATEIVVDLKMQGMANLPVPISVLLMFVMMATFSGTVMACLELSGERAIFRRERMTGQSPIAYVLSKLPFLFALTAVQCAVFLGVCLLEPALREINVVATLYALVVTAWASCALGLLVSSLDPTPGRLSVLLAVAVVLPQLVLSGALGPEYYAGMGGITALLADALPARWGFEMLLTAAFDRAGQAHWQWIESLVDERMGFLFGPGVFQQGGLMLLLLGAIYCGLAMWRSAAQTRPA